MLTVANAGLLKQSPRKGPLFGYAGFLQHWVLQKACCTVPAYDDELTLSGLWSDTGPDVHGEQSAAAVKDGGQRGHESSQHHSQHQTAQTWTKAWQEAEQGSCKAKITIFFFFLNVANNCVLTIRHYWYHQFRISYIGAAHLSPTNVLAEFRDHTANLIYKNTHTQRSDTSPAYSKSSLQARVQKA